MKILIAGAGKVGKALTDELSSEGHDITLIDRSSKVLEEAMSRYDVITLQGNAASKQILEEAGIDQMDVFIAATNADEVNLLACITVHAMNPGTHTIARIRDPQYVEQAYSMTDVFSLSLIINPERQAAEEIAGLLKYPGFLQRERFAKAHVEIVELKIKKNTLISYIGHNGEAIIPTGNDVISKGDTVMVVTMQTGFDDIGDILE